MTTTTRRHLLAAAAAVPLAAMLPALPSVAAEVLEPVCGVDRAAFTSRLHRWAMSVPQMGQRIDALLADVDYVLSTSEGTEKLLEASRVCDERCGRQISFDWLTGHDAYPNGVPCRMFFDEPEERAANAAEVFEAVSELGDREAEWVLKVTRAIGRDDYATARRLQELSYADLGIHVEQW